MRIPFVVVDEVFALSAVLAHALLAVVDVVLAVRAVEAADARAIVLLAELVARGVVLALVLVRLTRSLVFLTEHALEPLNHTYTYCFRFVII